MKVNEANGKSSEFSLDQRDIRILDSLRAKGEALSGQVMADELGISRVALWKRIERLKSLAYRIEGSHAGYRLVADDAIASWEFGDGRPVRYHGSVASTMDEAWAWAEEGAVTGAMVIAERQDAGRGQHGRAWLSPAGGLYLTLVLRPDLPMSHAGSLMLEAATWVAAWLTERCSRRLEVRWPNDLYCQGRKIGGVLVELAGSPDRVRFFTLGLGVNFQALSVAADDLSLCGTAAGLAELGTNTIRRRELAQSFRLHMDSWSARPELRPSWWASWAPSLGSPVRIEERPGSGEGLGALVRSRGFSRQGGLVLDVPEQRIILPGEIQRVHYLN